MDKTQDIQTTFDLGRNPISIKTYDNSGWAFTETRSYARGYQLVDFSTSNATGVSVTASGSYTYDDNNNLLTTKLLTVTRGAATLATRRAWTFTYDNKNRLKTYTNTTVNDVGNIWYDGRGRVWQRWVYDSSGETWDSSLTRYVYDGFAYAQEHNFAVEEVEGAWVYTYDQILTDYLRKPGGVRQKDISTVDQSETDEFLLMDSGNPSAKIKRETDSMVQRVELTSSGASQASGSQQDTTISKLGFLGGYTESFSGSTAFDPLVQMGGRQYLGGLGRFLSRMGNNAYLGPAASHVLKSIVASSIDDIKPMSLDDFGPSADCAICWAPGGHFDSPQCWRNTGQDEDDILICQMDLHPCTDCDGIHCPEDLKHDYGWEHGDFRSKWDYFENDWFGKRFNTGYQCDFDTEVDSLALWIIIAKVGMGNCISDGALRACILKSITDRIYGPKYYCDCTDYDTNYATTRCGRGICLNTRKINTLGNSNSRHIYIAAIILHELVHWCLWCKYKRPSPQHAIAAATCMRQCFEGYGPGDNPNTEYGGGGHGWPNQWENPSNCSVCDADWEMRRDEESSVVLPGGSTSGGGRIGGGGGGGWGDPITPPAA